MESPAQSLIQQEAQQGALFSSAVMEDAIFRESEERGEYTADRLFKQRPDIYRAVVRLVAEGRGQIYIGGLLSVSPATVRAVTRREGLTISIEKEALAEKAFAVAHLAFESLQEDLSDPNKRAKISPKDKAVIAGVVSDKGLLLAGEATVRVDVKTTAEPEHDDFNAYLERLKSAAGMGLGAEKNGAKGDLGKVVDGAVIEVTSEHLETEVAQNEEHAKE